MALDVDMAKELVQLIDAETFSLPKVTVFTFDRLHENTTVSELTVRITIETIIRERGSRGQPWKHTPILQVVVLAPQRISDEASLIAKLDFLDEVLDFVELAKPLGKIAAAFDPLQDERFDFDKFQNDGQFRSGVLVQYSLI